MNLIPAIKHPRGLIAVSSVCFGAFLLAWMIVEPILNIQKEKTEAVNRIKRFEGVAAGALAIAPVNVDSAVFMGQTADALSISIQRSLVDDARTAGLQLRQLNVKPATKGARNLSTLSFDLELFGDLQHWTTFLRLLGEYKPAIFIDAMNVSASAPTNPDLSLSIRLRLSINAILIARSP